MDTNFSITEHILPGTGIVTDPVNQVRLSSRATCLVVHRLLPASQDRQRRVFNLKHIATLTNKPL